MGRPCNVYVIGDTQVKPGVKNPLIPIAYDIVETQPDYVIHLGDHFDLPSLSSYDHGKHSFRSNSYANDIETGNLYFYEFWEIINAAGLKDKCKFIFINGNHEYRRDKALDTAPTEYIQILHDYKPDFSGWDKVLPFLKPYVLNGVCFVHFVSNEFSGRPASTASAGLLRRHQSFVCGHKQTLDYAEASTMDGRRIMGLIMGACYFHDEKYKGPQSNSHFRGVAYLRNLYKGEWEMEIRNLKTLDKKYGQG